MAAHRYWRVLCRINAGNASFTGLTEIEMATSAAGSDVSSTSFAIGSGSYQAGTATDAFDNDFTGDVVQWNGTGAGVYVGQDFGAGNEKEIVEWRIRPNKDAANRSFGEFDFQYSDDGSAWTTDFSATYTGWSVGTSVTFTKPSAAAHRYWRIRSATLFEGNTIGLVEIEMRATVGGSDECTGGTASSRTNFGASFTADKAFDDNTTTLHSGSGSPIAGSEWVQYDFGSGNDKSIVEVTMLTRDSTNDWDQVPKSGWVESSPDGRSFLARWSFANKAASRNYNMSTVEPASVPTGGGHRYWGIQPNHTQNGDVAFGVREIEMRDGIGGTDLCTGGQGISTHPTLNSSAGDSRQAFDNTTAEYGATGGVADTLAYDFGTPVALPKEIAITARGAINNPQAPTDFDLVYSDDNENWTVWQNFTTPGTWGSAEQRLFVVSSGRRRGCVMLMAA